MSEQPPPWARPREDTGQMFPSRRVREENPEPNRPARPPAAPGGPPPGPRPPAAPGDTEPAAVRRDPHIGLVTGPVTYTAVAEAHRAGIGVVAVVMSAVIAMVALLATALAGRAGGVLLLTGSALIAACVTAVVLADRLAIRRGMGSECRFVLRAETGRSVTWSLHGAPRNDLLRTGDLIRVVPGPRRQARAVEVLAAPDGPVVRRLTGGGLLAPVQWSGLALAVVLLAFTTAVLFGVF
ncbi:hypothetical protein [Paractinoplanes brasiliensis]|uniref:Uncharacterized protein n=1 Tax=Paractinoplanes brasiliensis TaxID=52695 RepID=A0A4R6K4E2_9ACTN|nr:hypothetical protein [Actinoplanes brasiliensis]TDO42145.1 hypothetical protein C8E87_5909 [Actinoplanes brasiliensis]GID31990.1 hypothetical protein Abr02nite_69730 [Actinoplanes brasiliensis]